MNIIISSRCTIILICITSAVTNDKLESSDKIGNYKFPIISDFSLINSQFSPTYVEVIIMSIHLAILFIFKM